MDLDGDGMQCATNRGVRDHLDGQLGQGLGRHGLCEARRVDRGGQDDGDNNMPATRAVDLGAWSVTEGTGGGGVAVFEAKRQSNGDVWAS
jgi:hypothetical protein